MSERAYDTPQEPRDIAAGPLGQYQPQDLRDRREGANEQASEYSQKVSEKVEQVREQAAAGVETVAELLREQAASHDGLAGQATDKVADGMEKTAAYLKNGSSPRILAGLGSYVRLHPIQSAGAAIAGGFIMTRMLKGRSPNLTGAASGTEAPARRAA